MEEYQQEEGATDKHIYEKPSRAAFECELECNNNQPFGMHAVRTLV